MQIIFDIITCLLLSAIPATFSYFLDYCLGHPMGEISIKAILFPYSYYLAKKAVPEKVYRDIISSLAHLLNHDDPDIRKQGQDQLKISIMTAGRDQFTYQQAIGMCPFCTNFWLCMIAAFIFFFTIPLSINPIFFFLITPIFSHTILRKL